MQPCGIALWYTAPQKTMNPMQGPLCTCSGIAEKGLFSDVVLPSVLRIPFNDFLFPRAQTQGVALPTSGLCFPHSRGTDPRRDLFS